jgi:polyhydroxybutyrate depolymerase
MKNLLLAGFLLTSLPGFSQQTIYDTMMHDGLDRNFILYVPASYAPGTPAPMVFNLHGYTSNADQQMIYGDFRSVADTAGFILVHPNGTVDGNGATHWNSGWGTGVNDVGFTSALIDSVAADYNIDFGRVYSTGMSNGGFMSYHLACELSERIAAIASVTGTMTANSPNTCSASHPTPVMEIHGTSDSTVPYNGNTTMTAIPLVMMHWVNFNNCSPDPVVTPVPDTNPGDGCTADHLLYPEGNNGVEVEHYRINDGGHTWPGAIFPIGVTNYDFNASEKIWQFFAQYNIDGRIVGIAEESKSYGISLSPNPVNGQVTINLGSNHLKEIAVKVLNSTGQMVAQSSFNNARGTIKMDLSHLESGMYFIRVYGDASMQTLSFVKT